MTARENQLRGGGLYASRSTWYVRLVQRGCLGMTTFRGLLWLFGLVLVSGLTTGRAAGTDVFPRYTVSTYAAGLQQPDDLAFHPKTGELYVSEESAGRVSVIRNGRAESVIERDFTVKDDIDPDRLDAERTRAYWLRNQLVSPEGIAFGPDGHLYVVEDSARGRVLKFEADSRNQYRQASVVELPALGEDYAWESICFSDSGQLYLAGSSYEASQTWGYSCVITRDTTQGWWMVDYGPLAAFSALTLMQQNEILIAGDESVGSLTWWDIDRKQEIQTLTPSLGSIEGVCPLPDGSLAVAVENTATGGQVLRINPVTGSITELASGLGTLESVVCDPASGKLFVSEDSSGRILCLTPDAPIRQDTMLLRVALRSSEAKRGLPPSVTPPFLQEFMSKVGVNLQESGSQSGGAQGPAGTGRAMTLEELGRRIPMVAGRVKVEPMPDVADPVTEVHFLSVYPNQMIEMDQRMAPPLCLFAARRQSGRVDRSQSVGGMHLRKYHAGAGWETVEGEAQILLPLNTCSTAENSNGVTVVMTFLGLDRFEDSFLTINYGRSNDAYFATSGDKLRVARASYMEQGPDGVEVCNFALTGVRTRRTADATWMALKPKSMWTLISPGFDNWVSRRAMTVMPDLVTRMRMFDRYISDTLLVDVPGDNLPAMAEQDKKLDAPSEKSPRDRQVEASPVRPLPPVADLRIAPKEDKEDASFTNMILQQIVGAWQRSWGGNN